MGLFGCKGSYNSGENILLKTFFTPTCYYDFIITILRNSQNRFLCIHYTDYLLQFLRIGIILVTFFTAINTMTLAWDLADIRVGLMAWLNLIAICNTSRASKTLSSVPTDWASKMQKSGIIDR